MNRKVLTIGLIMLLATNVTGCHLAISENDTSELVIPQIEVEHQTEEENYEEEIPSDEAETLDVKKITFADLSQMRFEFSSGAGAWGEEFTIEKDGSFRGLYHDTDMGDTGEGYENGTYYNSTYSGRFTDLTAIDEYTYQMKLADITYEESKDYVEIIGGTRYIYTESYCLGKTDTFFIYLPGTPLDKIPEEAYTWLAMMNESEDELTMTAIVDEQNGYGIYSVSRPSPFEDAQMTYDTYKQSYDYYGKKLAEEAETTLAMLECTVAMYRVSDDCLNYIWHLIRYNVDEVKFQEILAEQREWIEEKEAQAKENSAEFGDGTFSRVIYHDTLASLTIERCEELIEYLR